MTVNDVQNILVAAGLPIGSVSLNANPNKQASGPYNTYTSADNVVVGIDWSATPTSGQQTSAQTIIAGLTISAGAKVRTMYAIAASIFALTGNLPTPAAGTQKANIIAALFTGNIATGSQLWQQDTGPNAAAMSAVYAAITASNGSATFNAAQQLIMAAMYVQDNPMYLVNPSFDPTISVPGYSS